MIEEKFLKKLKDDYQGDVANRRQIGAAANDLLFKAKKTIFAIQRKELKDAEKMLAEMQAGFSGLKKRFGLERLDKEGSYKAAVEEYLEGYTLFQTVKGRKLAPVSEDDFSYDSYIGGICDMIGELVRYATNQAAAGHFAAVPKIKKAADDTMDQLADFDLTGYLRTKYDQARGHLRRLEQMAYEIKLNQDR